MKVKRRTIVYYVKKHLFHFLILIVSAVILSFKSCTYSFIREIN